MRQDHLFDCSTVHDIERWLPTVRVADVYESNYGFGVRAPAMLVKADTWECMTSEQQAFARVLFRLMGLKRLLNETP